ncbi:alpha/beta hydrolase fold domain-containing protein [Curtobacterium flaccumfaciens]|nr:alpha/beta hydrolase fold domain-containing protein [Curtobacterium flaccumfaciens]
MTITVHTAARPDGSALDLIAYRPHAATEPAPALLWFHAGAQVLGSGHDDAAYLADLATTIEAVVISVDYRLAPETPAPGAAEDGLLAYTWTRENADTLHIDPQHIGLAGASGGGAPAVAAALMIRDQGLPRPRLLALNYPMLDDRNTSASSHQVIDIGVFDRRENLDAWAAVLGDRAGTEDVDVYSARAAEPTCTTSPDLHRRRPVRRVPRRGHRPRDRSRRRRRPRRTPPLPGRIPRLGPIRSHVPPRTRLQSHLARLPHPQPRHNGNEPSSMTEQTATIRGTQIAYTDEGDGPAVFNLHGLMQHRQTDRLATIIDPAALIRPGIG